MAVGFEVLSSIPDLTHVLVSHIDILEHPAECGDLSWCLVDSRKDVTVLAFLHVFAGTVCSYPAFGRPHTRAEFDQCIPNRRVGREGQWLDAVFVFHIRVESIANQKSNDLDRTGGVPRVSPCTERCEMKKCSSIDSSTDRDLT